MPTTLMALRRSEAFTDRAFGIEVEFRANDVSMSEYAEALREVLENYGSRHALHWEEEYYHSDGSTWDLKYDGSAEFELASPRLKARDWPVFVAILRALTKCGATVDKSCGVHVHHEAWDMRLSNIRNLLRLWSAFDEAIHEALPPSRRDNQYCRRDATSMFHGAIRHDFHSWINAVGRYRSLNLTTWWRSGRVEFRAHHGSLDPDKIKTWLLMTQRFVETAARGRPRRIAPYLLSLHEGFQKLPRVVGARLANEWRKWLERRNPRTYADLCTAERAVALATAAVAA